MSAFQKLLEHSKKVSNFKHLSAILGWDTAVVMPSGGAETRANAMAELSVHIHALMTQPQLGDLFSQAETEFLSKDEQAVLREMKRVWVQLSIIPESLVQAQSLAGSKCEYAWRTQRGNNDWLGFEKNWAEVVKLAQEEAAIRADFLGVSAYDAMLDLYEPSMTSSSLDVLFSEVKAWLPSMIDEVIEKQQSINMLHSKQYSPSNKQKELGLEVMKLLQFNFEHGRLDESVHPFCGGVPTDVRITTRYSEQEFVHSLMGIVHETGHARYEQGLPTSLAGLAAGQARSMGIHESQSLFFEMQIGRNPVFVAHLANLAAKYFQGEEFSKDNLVKIYNYVSKGFIRVDADELTYPAHIILRYEIERDLMNGVIEHTDVPELWDEKMKSYLGLSTKGNYKDGCLQDIHWTDGSFGYFPSYTLGAMYAAQLMVAMKKTVDVDEALEKADLTAIFTWLANNIWSKGSLFSTNELIKQATGEALNAVHFKNHLFQRYLANK